MKTPLNAIWTERRVCEMDHTTYAPLMEQIERLHARHELYGHTPPEYFEPGMMEYLEQSDGYYDSETGIIMLQFESRGTRYEGRTEQIEKIRLDDQIQVVRDPENPFNRNNFRLMTAKGEDVGNMPAELCNAVAPLFDAKALILEECRVSYVEPISKRNRHAKQAVLFVKLTSRLY